MVTTSNVYHIICEGNSEFAYIHELNRYIKNKELGLHLKPYNLNGVASYNSIKKSIAKHVRQQNIKTILIKFLSGWIMMFLKGANYPKTN